MQRMSETHLREVEKLKGEIAQLRATNKRVRWPEDIRRRVGVLREVLPASGLAEALNVPVATLYGWAKADCRVPEQVNAPRVLQVAPPQMSEAATETPPWVLIFGDMRVSISMGSS